METLNHSLVQGESRALLIPDVTPALPVLGITSSLLISGMTLRLPMAEATLQRGDACEAVAELQDALLQKGFDPGNVDGIFGGQTEYAVMRFQEKNKLVNDRLVGQVTAVALGLDPEVSCTVATKPNETNNALITIPVKFGHVVTEGAALNVRSGPGETYSVLNTLDNGVVVRIVGQPVDSWFQLVEGGWIHSQWVKFVNLEPVDAPESPTPTAASTNTSTPKTTATPAAQAASPTATEASTTPAAKTVATTVAAQDSSASTASDSPKTQTEQVVKINTGGNPLNVRKGPGLEYEVLSQLPDLSEVKTVTPDAATKEWLELSTGGWISSTWAEVQTVPIANSIAKG